MIIFQLDIIIMLANFATMSMQVWPTSSCRWSSLKHRPLSSLRHLSQLWTRLGKRMRSVVLWPWH